MVLSDEPENMLCKIRAWRLSDAVDLAMALSNKKEQDNLKVIDMKMYALVKEQA